MPLLLLSIAVHICVPVMVFMRTGRVDGYAFNSLDSSEYYSLARNLAEHRTFSRDAAPPLKPDTWRTPGYPLFLALVMLVSGESPAALILIQQILGAFNALLLYMVAREFVGEQRASTVAVLYLAEPYHLLYSAWLMPTTLFVTVLLVSWHLWHLALTIGRWPQFAMLGLTCSALVLVRPVGIIIPLGVLAGLILLQRFRPSHENTCGPPRQKRARQEADLFPSGTRKEAGSEKSRDPARAKARGSEGDVPGGPVDYGSNLSRTARTCMTVAIVAFLIALAVPCGAWMMRNKVVAGRFAISDQAGVVLAYFKATEIVLWRQGRTAERYNETSLDPGKLHLPHSVWDEIDARLADWAIEQTGGEKKEELSWRNLAQGNRSSLNSFDVSRALAKIAWTYLADDPLSTAACCLAGCASLLTFPLNLAVEPPASLEGRRAPRFVMAVPYVVLCLVVIVRLVVFRPDWAVACFPLMGTICLLLASTPQTDPRFRVPMIPFLLFVALLPRNHAGQEFDSRSRPGTVEKPSR